MSSSGYVFLSDHGTLFRNQTVIAVLPSCETDEWSLSPSPSKKKKKRKKKDNDVPLCFIFLTVRPPTTLSYLVCLSLLFCERRAPLFLTNGAFLFSEWTNESHWATDSLSLVLPVPRAHTHTVPASLASSLPPLSSSSSHSLHPCLCLSHSPAIRHSNNIIALTASWGLAEKPSCLKAIVTLYPNNASKGNIDITTFKNAKKNTLLSFLLFSLDFFILNTLLNPRNIIFILVNCLVKVQWVKMRHHQIQMSQYTSL